MSFPASPLSSSPSRRRLLAALVTVLLIGILSPGLPSHAAGANLAAGKTFTASSSVDSYAAGNAGDGNAGSYWESNSNAFAQWIQVDLGSSVSVNRAVLKLPPVT